MRDEVLHDSVSIVVLVVIATLIDGKIETAQERVTLTKVEGS